MGLDEKAIEAVSAWRFEPARKDGKPVAVLITAQVNFRIYGGGNLRELQKKADAGEPKAELDLARTLLEGRMVTKNEALGLQWLEKAAKSGLAEAQFEMCVHGLGKDVAFSFEMGEQICARNSVDYVNAYMWYELARRGGYKRSDKKLKKMASKLSPAQLSDAKSRVENWPNPTAK